MNLDTIRELADRSMRGEITFPQVVARLVADGVESYHVDYVRGENRYYMPNGESYVEAIEHRPVHPAADFSAAGVQAAIRRVQAGEILYPEFSDLVRNAGCVYYIVYLAGKQVIYFGRNGDCHIERFPQ